MRLLQRWLEWGVSDSTFVEEWVNVDESGGSIYAALRRPASGEMLLVVGDWFSYVKDNRSDHPPAESRLGAFLSSEDISIEEKRAMVGNAEYSNGRVSEGWKIQLSTLPWREGETLPLVDLLASEELEGVWEQVGGGLSQADLLAMGGGKL